jgi:hypothetical protein
MIQSKRNSNQIRSTSRLTNENRNEENNPKVFATSGSGVKDRLHQII